jgi:acetoin utilization deacetylase AcuC-like enzyme
MRFIMLPHTPTQQQTRLNAYYSDTFVLPLPPEHRFPMQKYALLHQWALEKGVIAPERMHIAAPATDDQLALAHDRAYIDKVRSGTLSPKEQRRIGFPWSPQLARRSRCTVGGTIMACRAVLSEAAVSGWGAAANLAGGTHHAYHDHGQGYCVFNDLVVAARTMQTEGRARRVVILDLDVHQGNGTASLCAHDPTIFTFSIHGAKNFPFHKERSDLDIELPDGTTDSTYLALVEEGTRRAIAYANADLAIYLAGADPYERDRLGRMKISMAGLAERDRIVLSLCRDAGLPVAIVMGGGYAPDVEEIAAIHLTTIETAAQMAHSSPTAR